MRNGAIHALLLAACASIAGCVMPEIAPRAVLDEQSGISLIVVDRPMVFARDRRDVAVQARDYLTLVAAEVNEQGRRRLLLVAHQWSTIDSRVSDVVPQAQPVLLLVADGRDLRLAPFQGRISGSIAANPALMRPEDARVVTTFYGVDAATLDFIAASRTLAASYPDSFALPFKLWSDGRDALKRLLAAVAQK